MIRRLWTQAETDLLHKLYATHTNAEIGGQIGRTASAVKQKARKLGLYKPDEFYASEKSMRLRKGMAPHNKGVKGWRSGGRSQETQFKPGHVPVTTRPAGAYRCNRDGVLEQKIHDERGHRWRSVHELVWIREHGPVPKGHIVIFKPGMRTVVPEEITIDRVECVSRAENLRRNSIHRYPPELKRAIRQHARLKREIRNEDDK